MKNVNIEEEMTIRGIWLGTLDMLRKQGLSFIILALGVYYFSEETNKLQGKVELCNSLMMKIYQEQNALLLDVLGKNTTAIENLKKN